MAVRGLFSKLLNLLGRARLFPSKSRIQCGVQKVVDFEVVSA